MNPQFEITSNALENSDGGVQIGHSIPSTSARHHTPPLSLLAMQSIEQPTLLSPLYQQTNNLLHRHTNNDFLRQLRAKDIEIDEKNEKILRLEGTLGNLESRCSGLIRDSEDLGFMAEDKEEMEVRLEEKAAFAHQLEASNNGLRRQYKDCMRDLRIMREQNKDLVEVIKRQAQALPFQCTHAQGNIICHSCESHLRPLPNSVFPAYLPSIEDAEIGEL